MRWTTWEEEDISRYNDTLAEKLKETGGLEDADSRERYVAMSIEDSACEAEWARLERVAKGKGDEGGIFEEVRAEKKDMLEAKAR